LGYRYAAVHFPVHLASHWLKQMLAATCLVVLTSDFKTIAAIMLPDSAFTVWQYQKFRF